MRPSRFGRELKNEYILYPNDERKTKILMHQALMLIKRQQESDDNHTGEKATPCDVEVEITRYGLVPHGSSRLDPTTFRTAVGELFRHFLPLETINSRGLPFSLSGGSKYLVMTPLNSLKSTGLVTYQLNPASTHLSWTSPSTLADSAMMGRGGYLFLRSHLRMSLQV